MKIIILGAGQVGSSVAASLVGEANDITVVDQDEKRLQALRNHYDLRTIKGNGAHPSVLLQAGAEDADMLLAVTNSDEINMVACQVAYTLFHTPTKIARVREPNYQKYPQIFSPDSLAVDVVISPEELVTRAIQRLVDYPDALQVLDFANGKMQLVAVKAYSSGTLVGKQLRTLPQHHPGIESRVAAIYRKGQAIIPDGGQTIEPDDEVFFVASTSHVRAMMGQIRQLDKTAQRILIGGGGNVGRRLAEILEQKNYHVKLIEHNSARARQICVELQKTIVLEGDVADAELLKEARISDVDIFCALTNDDQVNILSSMLAKRLGARKVMALINRPAYVDLVENSNIDIAVSPQQVTIGTLLSHIRRGDVKVVHALRRGAAEAMEAIAHGDRNNSKVVGRRIEEIHLPPGATIAAIARGDEVLMARHDTVIEANDHVILFLVDKSQVRAVEKLFQVGITFF